MSESRVGPPLFLRRIGSGPDGTLGVLGTKIAPNTWATLEEEALGNQQRVSRIPAGTYECVRTQFYKGGYRTFEITNVPGRSRILFHIGNTEENTDGCVIIGRSHGVLLVVDEDSGVRRWKAGIRDSRIAFKSFMQYLESFDSFPLTIVDEGSERE